MTAIATPMFTNVVHELSAVMCKMHKPESAYIPIRSSRGNVNGNDPNATSVYMTELVAKIRWVFREFISKCYVEVRLYMSILNGVSRLGLNGPRVLQKGSYICIYCTLPSHPLQWTIVFEWEMISYT